VDRADLVALLRGGVIAKGGRWVDLGAGEGAFTLALADLLGPAAHITAVDRDAGALRRLRSSTDDIEILHSDFTRPLGLTDLDGVVMANSLHFVRNKAPVLAAVRDMLKPGGALIVVEYDTDRGNAWVPHPFSRRRWEQMADEAGFERTRFLHSVPSRWLGSIYSAISFRPNRAARRTAGAAAS